VRSTTAAGEVLYAPYVPPPRFPGSQWLCTSFPRLWRGYLSYADGSFLTSDVAGAMRAARCCDGCRGRSGLSRRSTERAQRRREDAH